MSLSVKWLKQLAVLGNADYRAPYVSVDSANNIYMAYPTTGTVSGGTKLGSDDICVAKMDPNGNVIWIKQMAQFNTPGFDYYQACDVDPSGNVYVVYATDGTVSGGSSAGSNDIVIFKLDTNGNLVWVKQPPSLNTSTYVYQCDIHTDYNGNMFITAMNTGTISGGSGGNIFVAKINANGNVVWAKQDNSFLSTNTQQYPVLSADTSGNLYCAYFTNGVVSGGTNNGGWDIAVFKMDPNGNLMWIKQQPGFNTTDNEYDADIDVDGNGNVVVSYWTDGTVSGGTNLGPGGGMNDLAVFKLDTNGNLVWIRQDAFLNTSSGREYFSNVEVDEVGNVFVFYSTTGTTSGGTTSGGSDVVIAKLDPNGNPVSILQSQVLNSASNEGTQDLQFMAIDSNNDLIITYLTGSTLSGGEGGSNFAVAKVSQPPLFAVPDAPTGVTATPESLRALVSWTKPANNGGKPITSYTVTSSPGGFTGTVNGADNTSCYVYGLSNGTAYTFTVVATSQMGNSVASAASGAVTPVADAPTTAVTTAVASNDTTSITNYVAGASASTPTQYTDLSIDMRTSLNAGTVGATTQQKVDTKLAYIDSMRTKVGADNFTVPQAKFSEFLQTFTTVANQTFTPKPIVAYLPAYTGASATIDVSAASPSSYVMVEVPIGYTVVLQNGAVSISLTYNGTNYSDGTNTYNAGAVIVLGTKTFTLIGIGSGGFDVQDSSSVICVAKGSLVQTPTGDVPVQSLRTGDFIKTGDGRTVQITKMQQIVVVSATPTNAPYIIEAGAFGPGMPPNRMEVSPRHAIQLRPGLWEIPREAATENKLVYQNKDVLGKQFVYYHFSLPNYARDTAIVNGQVTEVLNDGQYKESYYWNAAKGGYERVMKANTSNTLSK